MKRSRKRAPKLQAISERLTESFRFRASYLRCSFSIPSGHERCHGCSPATSRLPGCLSYEDHAGSSAETVSVQCGIAWTDVAVVRRVLVGSGGNVPRQWVRVPNNREFESFHSQWQAFVSGKVRESPLSIFEFMQTIFQRQWQEKFRWGTQMHVPAAALLNSEGLRSAGRSPAVDFWQAKDQTKLCGCRNYYHMHRRTDAAGSVSPMACRNSGS